MNPRSTIELGNAAIEVNHQAHLDAGMDTEIRNGNEEAEILISQGKPIEEPVVIEGPFIMNTQEEIAQAYSNFSNTQFGGWPWPSREVVHGRDKGCFSRHKGGSSE